MVCVYWCNISETTQTYMKNSKKSYQNGVCLIKLNVVMTDRQNGVLEWICFKCLSTFGDSYDLNTNTIQKCCGKIRCIDLADISISCSYFWFSFTEEMLSNLIEMPHLSWTTVSVSGHHRGKSEKQKRCGKRWLQTSGCSGKVSDICLVFILEETRTTFRTFYLR